MCALHQLIFTRALVLLTFVVLCACAPQSYYSSNSYSTGTTSPYRADPYRSTGYSPYRDSNREYYDALRQRRLRALADSYKGIYNSISTTASSSSSSRGDDGGASKAQRYYSTSRLPVAAAAISASSSDDSGSTTTSIYANNNNDRYNNNYNRYEAYAANGQRAKDTPSSTTTNKQQDASNKQRVSKADEQNAKFAGISNQEADEENTKTLSHLKRKKLRRCFPFGRDAQGDEVTPPPAEQGRLLWDVNVYNIYGGGGYAPPIYGGGCGGLVGGLGGGLGGVGGLANAFAGAGGLGGGGLLSDPIAAAYAPPNRFNNFLQLFAPGILQNALAATARPSLLRPQADSIASEANDLANDPEVDPGYSPVAARPSPVRRPNRVYYDSVGAAPITPAQLVGGVATTVNGIIQQLTGNVQPVYPGYRSLSYGK